MLLFSLPRAASTCFEAQQVAATTLSRPEPALKMTALNPPGGVPAHGRASLSLARALGLRVSRIVIDAGHGGHDDGAVGSNGVREKDIVLDVALRTAAIARGLPGIEVVLTREDDRFIALRERTAIANEGQADLFLSIHANSSPQPASAGPETYFLNFNGGEAALEVAARENAGSGNTLGSLQNLVRAIALNDRLAESETFAATLQAALFGEAGRVHNRGTKRAPFIVLINAAMPSALAEIGFLSNGKDAANLGRPEYRQKLAEALFEGVRQYAESLGRRDLAGPLRKPRGAVQAASKR